jgi:hypothetical protein
MNNGYTVNLKSFKKNKGATRKKHINTRMQSHHKNKTKQYTQSGGAWNVGNFDKINQTYNANDKYIDVHQIKKDLKHLVDTYIKLESAYKRKHGEVMTLYQAYTDLYQTSVKQNNKTEGDKYKGKLFSINSDIIQQEEHYHKNRDVVLAHINNIKSYIKNNKQHFIEVLGLQKINTVTTDNGFNSNKPIKDFTSINHMENTSNIINQTKQNNNYNNNNFNPQNIRTVDEIKIINSMNNDTQKCPKCRKVGMGVVMIPKTEPQPEPKPIQQTQQTPNIHQHIYIQQPPPAQYQCPMCMVVAPANTQHMHQTHQLQQLQQTVNKPPEQMMTSMMQQIQQHTEISKNPKINECYQQALQNPVSGMSMEQQVQQCIMQNKVSLDEIDIAYLKKHNELMTIYKAYQTLYGRVIEYKKKLDEVKPVRIHSVLTREQLSRMVKDQDRIMNSISVMQQNMVQQGILQQSETVDVNNFTGKEIQQLNHNLGEQLNKIVQTKPSINLDEKTKAQITQIISEQQQKQNELGIGIQGGEGNETFSGKILQIVNQGPTIKQMPHKVATGGLIIIPENN